MFLPSFKLDLQFFGKDDDDNKCWPISEEEAAARKTLNLPTEGPITIKEVDSAYRKESIKYHPDKNDGEGAEEFKQFSKNKEILVKIIEREERVAERMEEEIAELVSTARNQEENLNLASEIGLAFIEKNAELGLKIKDLEKDLIDKENKIDGLYNELSRLKNFRKRETQFSLTITQLEEERKKNENEIQQLNTQINKLGAKNRKKEGIININGESTAKNEEKLTTLTEEITKLNKKLKETTEKNRENEQQNINLKEEIEKLVGNEQDIIKKIRLLTKEKENLEIQVKEQQKSDEDYVKKIKQYCTELEKRLKEDYENELATKTEEIRRNYEEELEIRKNQEIGESWEKQILSETTHNSSLGSELKGSVFKELEASQKEISELKEKNTKLLNQQERLKKGSKAIMTKRNKQVSQQNNKIDWLQTGLGEKNSVIAELRKEIAQKDQEIKKLEREKSNRQKQGKKQIENRSKEIKRLLGKNGASVSQLDDKQAEVENLTEQIRQLSQQVITPNEKTQLENKLSETQSVNEKYVFLLKKLLEELRDIKQNEKENRPPTPDGLLSYEETLFNEIKELQLYVNDLNIENQRLLRVELDNVNELVHWQGQAQSAAANNWELKKKINELYSHLENKDEEKMFLETDLEKWKFSVQIITEKNQELQVLIDAKNERINQLGQQTVQIDDNLEQVSIEKDRLAEQVQNLEAIKRELESKQKETTRTTQHLGSQIKNLEKKGGKSQEEIEGLKKTLGEKSMLLDNSEKKNDDLKEQLTEEKSAHQQTQQERQATETERNRYRDELATAEKAKQKIQEDLTNQKNSLEQKNTNLKNQSQKVEENLIQASQKNLTFQAQIRDQAKLIKELNKVEEKLIEANLQVKKTNQKSTTQVAKLTHQVEELSKKVRASCWEKEVLAEKNSILNRENTDLKQKITESDKLLDDKDLQISEAIQEWNKKNIKVRTLQKRLREQDENWEKEVDELNTEIEELKNQAENLETELHQEKDKNINLYYANISLQGENENLKTDLGRANKRKNKLLGKLHTLRTQQELDSQKAEQKNVCQTLIKWKDIPKNSGNLITSDKLEKAIASTNNSFIDVIDTAQQHLGVGNLTQITTTHSMPDEKSLGDLIEFYRDNKDGASTPPSQTPIITKLEAGEPNETIIVNQIIQECDLGLTKDSSLTQVIGKINKLIQKKPPIIRPVKQFNDTPFGEDLVVIKQLELASLTQLFGATIDSAIQRQIQEATNYSQVVSARQSFLAKHLTPQVSYPTPTKPNSFWQPERIFWLILLMVSLLTIGGLLVKIKGMRNKKLTRR